MIFQIIEENGVKKIQALTADTGTGAPVGSYLYLEKKSNPSGYLYCDGSTFDQTKYPALYQYLGTNVLPDWREFSAVGAEQNTTNVYDAQTNPNGVIHDHDVYTEGQAKDDQLQEHHHRITDNNGNQIFTYNGSSGSGSGKLELNSGNSEIIARTIINGRSGTTTHGKQKAVFIYIKATSGLTENQQENVLNTINENNSYSTTEHKTGKKWIDGKDIWSIVLSNSETITDSTPTWGGLQSIIANLNIDYCITSKGTNVYGTRYLQFFKTDGFISFYSGVLSGSKIILEYTKTTDN